MRLGIIGPTEREIMPFINKLDDKQLHSHAMINFYVGNFENIEVVAAFSGVCKVNAAIATQIMIDKFDVTQLILTGVAGALCDSLQIGDIVIGSEIAYHDVAKGILTEYHPWMEDIYFKPDTTLMHWAEDLSKSDQFKDRCHIGRIITGEAFITEKERDLLIEAFEPLCVDMESASFAHVCYANSIPFLVIRSISDLANEDGSDSFEKNMEVAALNSIILVEEIIKRVNKP
ncbi:5'-methylthioadenosine/adenosylhomocysteine nucleosidase [Alkaliphilus hydrothermalis]|uniref:adenosylhomocysteine nucleosidase n=1 Tax=Alkaliphilus hydrothermalis TaxID=1482730 RepID=A0ABS2NLF3_9FIRM|nr:5'-methylthioadenosine/adenosylhomocysteine nucleosidase [Alkaliphilus hydrothermalis]MBM7613750.1 adenosylhomocysteine nucleosidase [Alkaliphilus hydrothermalis]